MPFPTPPRPRITYQHRITIIFYRIRQVKLFFCPLLLFSSISLLTLYIFRDLQDIGKEVDHDYHHQHSNSKLTQRYKHSSFLYPILHIKVLQVRWIVYRIQLSYSIKCAISIILTRARYRLNPRFGGDTIQYYFVFHQHSSDKKHPVKIPPLCLFLDTSSSLSNHLCSCNLLASPFSPLDVVGNGDH